MKFKVGDRVEITNVNGLSYGMPHEYAVEFVSFAGTLVGQRGVIAKIEDSFPPIAIKLDNEELLRKWSGTLPYAFVAESNIERIME